MTIYLDLVFLWNSGADLILAAAVQRLLGLGIRWKRTLGAALLGGLYGVAAVLPGAGWLLHPMWALAAALGTVFVLFGRCSRWPRYWLLLLITGCGLAGAVELLRGNGGAAAKKWPLFLTAFLLCYLLLSRVFPRTAESLCGRAKLLPVRVRMGGKEADFLCLLDTGNGLTAPNSGRPVLVAWEQALQPVLAAVEPWQLHEIFYTSLGNATGKLLYFTADEALIDGKTYQNQPVAISRDPLSGGAAYGGLWSGRGSEDAA